MNSVTADRKGPFAHDAPRVLTLDVTVTGDLLRDYSVIYQASSLASKTDRLGALPDTPSLQELCDRTMRDGPSAIELGRALFSGLFTGDGERLFRTLLGEARADTPSRSDRSRVRLRLSFETPDLSDLPWELLFDPTRERFLATDRTVTLSRRPSLLEPIPARTQDGPIRILGLFPESSGLDTEGERKTLLALASIPDMEVDVQDRRVTLDSIRDAIWRLRPHIVHFAGHGFHNRRGAGLCLDSTARRSDVVDATSWARLLTREDTPPALVTLSACEGGLGTVAGQRGVAGALLRHGISAVVAMQHRIGDRLAANFCHEFYRSLGVDRRDVEVAVNRGRARLLEDQSRDPSFASPMLFLRGDVLTFRSDRAQDVSASDPPARHATTPSADSPFPGTDSVPRAPERPQGPLVGAIHDSQGVFVGDNTFTVQGDLNFGDREGSSRRVVDKRRESARRHLDRKGYDLARKALLEVLQRDGEGHEDHYLLALATLAGRRPKELRRRKVQEVEGALEQALRLEQLQHYYLLRAILEFDFYVLNGLREPPPGHEDLLREAESCPRHPRQLARLLDHLPDMPGNPGYIRLIELARAT